MSTSGVNQQVPNASEESDTSTDVESLGTLVNATNQPSQTMSNAGPTTSSKKKKAAAARTSNGSANKTSPKPKVTKDYGADEDTTQPSTKGSPLSNDGGILAAVSAVPNTSVVGKGQKSLTSSKSYVQLVHDAIEALKDRTGSSMPAVKKWLMQEYPHLEDNKHFRRHLNQALKSGTDQGRFEKIRSSFKIASSWKQAEREKKQKRHRALAAIKAKENAAKAKENAAKAAALAAKKSEAAISPKTHKELVQYNKAKRKKLQEILSPEQFHKVKAQMKKKEDALHKKEEAERKEAERMERIRKRRFPMEDTKLHEEDKELCVKPPPDVKPRPPLPYFWTTVLPLGDPNRKGKTSDQILRNSKADGLEQGSRGLVPDLLQVYHFFRGDVHFTGDTAVMKEASTTKRKKRGGSTEQYDSASLVPDFSLSNLIYATEEIINGNARKSRLVPPLISHLFVTCLRLLCREAENDGTDSFKAKDPQQHLQYELNKYLLPALTPGSWPDICHLYMDAMERFFSTDSSREPNVLLPLNTDLNYLFGRIDEPAIPMTPAPANKKGDTSGDPNEGQFPLPEGYTSYLGPYSGVLYRAHEKLGRSEAWTLTAEEIMALLRALTDDVLGSYPGIAENIAGREEEMYELLKAKKAADSKWRKVKFAYEGPKKPKKVAADETAAEGAEIDANGTTEVHKPNVSKKEYETAAKAQQKANDAYEKGIRLLVARTEPVGYDRNCNAVYCFRHDPEVLYVEELRPLPNPSEHCLPENFQFRRRSWHVIETTSLFDAFASSLDIRGKREQDLYEGMLGPVGTHQSLRRFLHDDVKANAESSSRQKEREALIKKLEAAKAKCDEEKGRRSGRLADHAEEELARVQKELERFEEAALPPTTHVVSYEELTGLSLLRSYDSGTSRRETRRTREQKEASIRPASYLPCSKLVPTGNIDGSGIVGMMVSRILELEESCQSVSPWDPAARKAWIFKVEDAVVSWYNLNSFYLGPSAPISSDNPQSKPHGLSATTGESYSKRRRTFNSPESVSGALSIPSVISSLKQPLLDLESRVANITYAAIVARDAEIADGNMSEDESGGENQEELDLAWKKELHRLRKTPARKHLKVREYLVKAISLARKAHASEVVAELRSALLLFHPNAANESKKAGIKVLEAHGDFDGATIEEDAEAEETEDEKDKAEEHEMVSVLSAEAALLTGCLGGSDEATRADWVNLVKSCKTLSRLSSLTAAFGSQVDQKLARIIEERDDLLEAISNWQKEANKLRGRKKKTNRASLADSSGLSEVWADVAFTDDICMAKAEEWPWWPAKVCEAKDEQLKERLQEQKRVLVALLGENGGLRIVTEDDIRPFTGKPIAQDGVEVDKKTRSQLDECLAMARRIQRGNEKSKNRKNK